MFYIDKTKRAIKDQSVFDGLSVDDPNKFYLMFLRPQFKLLELQVIEHDVITYGHVIFEVKGDSFVFHLVNFTSFKTHDMTEKFIKYIVPQLCKLFDLKTIEATAERAGMAIKLEHLGFKNVEGNIYRAEVQNVL